MLAGQSFSTTVSMNLSEISKCWGELQSEPVVPTLANKKRAKGQNKIRAYGWKNVWKTGERWMRRKYCEQSFMSSLTLIRADLRYTEDSSFKKKKKMRRMISEGHQTFLGGGFPSHTRTSHTSINHPMTHSWEFLSWWIRLLWYILGSALSSGLSWQVKAIKESLS